MGTQTLLLYPGNFLEQNLTDRGVLVSEVNINALGFHHPGRYQHPLQETMRVALQVKPVFEGAGLALVGVHRHQSGTVVTPDDAPLAPGWETGAPQTPQTRVTQHLNQLIGGMIPGHTIGEQRVTPCLFVGIQTLVIRNYRVRVP